MFRSHCRNRLIVCDPSRAGCRARQHSYSKTFFRAERLNMKKKQLNIWTELVWSAVDANDEVPATAARAILAYGTIWLIIRATKTVWTHYSKWNPLLRMGTYGEFFSGLSDIMELLKACSATAGCCMLTWHAQYMPNACPIHALDADHVRRPTSDQRS